MPECSECNTAEGTNGVTKMRRCGRCHSQLYCSTQCQRKAWKIHKEKCISDKEKKEYEEMLASAMPTESADPNAPPSIGKALQVNLTTLNILSTLTILTILTILTALTP